MRERRYYQIVDVSVQINIEYLTNIFLLSI